MTTSDGLSCERFRPQVIADVDAGADDALALLLLIAAQKCREIDIIAITCVHGNTTVNNVCTNVLRILEASNCVDIPVFQGARKPLVPLDIPLTDPSKQFFGNDGFGDIEFQVKPDSKLLQNENAIEALHRLASQKGKVSLICLGPLTNIALAMRTYSKFCDYLQDIYIMGGSCTGIGNVTSAAEFNFYCDPEAAYIVLSSALCPIKLLPWETSLKVEISLDWRFEVLGKVNGKHMGLLNAIEKKVYKESPFSAWYPCDAVVAAIFLQPNIIIKSSECHISIELQGRHTRGQVVVDHLKTQKNNVTVIEEIDCDALKNQLLWAAACSNTIDS